MPVCKQVQRKQLRQTSLKTQNSHTNIHATKAGEYLNRQTNKRISIQQQASIHIQMHNSMVNSMLNSMLDSMFTEAKRQSDRDRRAPEVRWANSSK